jgi:hypothetical protein
MATRTLGTNATTTLTAVPFPNAAAGQPAMYQDIGSINALILDDNPNMWPANGSATPWLASARPIWPSALRPEGLLHIPNRGVLKVFYGDWIGVDAVGWPVLISARSIQNTSPATSWTHSGAVT